MHTTIIDNAYSRLAVSQGETLGNRQDAVAKFDFEGLLANVAELEVAA